MKTAIISIKPEYVKKIFSGEKKYEFRKCNIDSNLFFIYETAPVSAVVGYVLTGKFISAVNKTWEYLNRYAGISESDFYLYYKDKRIAYAYEIKQVYKFAKPIPLEHFGLKRPPQSFCYLKGENNEN